MCFDFLYNFFSETFFILRRIERDMIKSVHRSACKVPAILVRFKEIEFPQQVLEKKLKYHENPSSGNRAVPCRRTDGHDVADGGFSKF